MFDEEEGEGGVLVKDIPMKSLSMYREQAEGILRDIEKNELSQTEGLPVLWYHTGTKQLIVDDGNHRIFQKWINGENNFDAYIYSGDWSNYLRNPSVEDEIFDCSEKYR
jgi:hypothetical protein